MRPPEQPDNGTAAMAVAETANSLSNGHSSHYALSDQRPTALPVIQRKWDIVRHIRSRPTSIIVSQTASGKTTEIPKFLYESGFCSKHQDGAGICITQPRRVAATSVARYVARMMRCQLGTRVGYSVRFDDMSSPATRIKYVTDGMLLREIVDDPQLTKYSVVILDEAHERTINNDVLCSLLRDLQKKRQGMGRPLKIVIMSATVNPEVYLKFFEIGFDCVISLQGRQHQVGINYTTSVQDDYVHAALMTVLKIVQEKEAGDILVFCTGQEEIESMVRSANEVAQELSQDIKAMPLYSALPQAIQERCLTPSPPGVRKIIFATNIAETSITIPGVKFVVDTCRAKCRQYNPATGMELLRVEKISQAQAWQRSGRAGRVSDGECYRLLTTGEFTALRPFPIAEIRRCALSTVIMSILALRIDIRTFDWLESPADEAIKQALHTLKLLGATEIEEESGQVALNSLGSMMRRFPLEPTYSRCIFGAKMLTCVEPMVTIVAVLSADGSPIASIGGAGAAAGEDDGAGGSGGHGTAIRQFGTNEGDLIMYLNMYTKFNQVGGNKEWCDANAVNRKTLNNVKSIREQLRNVCGQMSLSLSKSTNDNIRKALVTGLFRNVAYRVKANQYRALESKRDVVIHPSSCMFRQNPEVVIFTELVKTTKCYIRNVTPIDPTWYNELAPNEYARRFVIPSSVDQ
ncbi:putative ATP-dependent RNA helicase DHX33 [Varroa jacobsoni]|uniref:RNA helicase n=1 Tax=Varroa destructor TaxID=109461 RepID=A0A7M7KQL5_VARDE|nr:putative ATP-dependent RNA helicase DHX33 [Varroa destructor]XP_022699856.1 putative ATP-dependent RNA helicase DHX33 [Varroa jacobsoni]